MFIQLTEHFNNIFHNYLAAFRKGFGCTTTLLRLVEDLKEDLDKQQYVGTMLMDLSMALDCLSNDLILAKLRAYGLSLLMHVPSLTVTFQIENRGQSWAIL